MTDVLQQYSPRMYDSLPGLVQANEDFALFGGIVKIDSALASIAQKYPNAASFGIQLLHRHCSLSSDEIMLAWQGTTIPFKIQDIAPAKRANNIVPTLWGLDPRTHTFTPLEFALVDDGSQVPKLDENMARDVAAILKAYGLDRILGLAVLPEGTQAGAEITLDRSNIVLPADVFASASSFIEVLWTINNPKDDPDATKRCKIYCSDYIPRNGEYN
ncbi:unnamed protein product [Tilletia controversa]|uniref:Uncharacterized protein n=1 Tax=Tilletia controversa TaxID=13291 RepID=A0A8X7SUZ8_9BASI|nr:hypothetical protein A4X06_0g6021 [Tilletia controversa]CAD6889715.1 unnamed protein product [Tilletia caries]CAD6933132.1 unnamed protein product [Tilletia controversa]CAD6955332.1 unnamed protein product [Tilletia controversa]CAD7063172.1 unnamed protein product [Tilletia caries]